METLRRVEYSLNYSDLLSIKGDLYITVVLVITAPYIAEVTAQMKTAAK